MAAIAVFMILGIVLTIISYRKMGSNVKRIVTVKVNGIAAQSVQIGEVLQRYAKSVKLIHTQWDPDEVRELRYEIALDSESVPAGLMRELIGMPEVLSAACCMIREEE